MPGTDLLLFAELQRQRLQAALISTTPRQTFTAGPKIVVYLRTPAHRMSYSDRTHQSPRWDKPHGTLASYVHLQCRCGLCSRANAAYRNGLKQRPQSEPTRAHAPYEHGTTRKYRRGCRCKPCLVANRLYNNDWRAAHFPASTRRGARRGETTPPNEAA